MIGFVLNGIWYGFNLYFSYKVSTFRFRANYILFLWNLHTHPLHIFLLNCWSFSYWFVEIFDTLRKFANYLWWVVNVFSTCLLTLLVLVFDMQELSIFIKPNLWIFLIASEFYVKVGKTILYYKKFLPGLARWLRR